MRRKNFLGRGQRLRVGLRITIGNSADPEHKGRLAHHFASTNRKQWKNAARERTALAPKGQDKANDAEAVLHEFRMAWPQADVKLASSRFWIRTGPCMSPRLKKFIGTLVIFIWLPVYILFAWAIGLHVLPSANGVTAFLYYALAGTLWIVPIGLMLPWMYRGTSGE
jgi:hypothetical protein